MREETSKPKMTKEELAKFWKDYYDWINSTYPVEHFEIQGNNGELLSFYRGAKRYKDDSPKIYYYLKDSGYQKAYEERKKQHLLGEESSSEDINQVFPSKAFICINTDEKCFNFGVYENSEGKGYGRTIYDNYLQVLERLNIPDKEQYELAVRGSSDHTFLKRMQTEKLVSKACGKPDEEKALQLLAEFSEYPNTMKFSELNTIIQYAINSNIPTSTIATAINDNGFNIFYTTINGTPNFEKADVEKFKSFGITGLKPTSLHRHFMRNRSFGFLKLLDNIDTDDATLEFRRIFEEVKAQHEKEKDDGSDPTYQTIKNYGVAEHILLNWHHFGLLLKNVNSNIQNIVKKGAINMFGKFDPEHEKEWHDQDVDYNSLQTFRMLREAKLMDKDTYIALYQKALNRNYSFQKFEKAFGKFIHRDEREKAREEIRRDAFYPSPRGFWQKSSIQGKPYKIVRIPISKKVANGGNVRNSLEQKILKQGIAEETKIRTDMVGRDKDGNTILVDNLKDWLFGVPGASGNLHLEGNSIATLPPQTPEFAVRLIEDTLKDIEYPGYTEQLR